MAGRQGVHISYLIVTMVISLGLIVAVVLTNSELQSAKVSQQTAEERVVDREDKIRAQTAEINAMRKLISGQEDDKVDLDGTEKLLGEAGGQLAEALERKQAEDYIDAGLIGLFADTTEIIKLKQAEAKRQAAQADSHADARNALQGTKDQLEAAKNEELSGLRDQLSSEQAAHETTRSDLTEELQKARAQLSEASDTHSDEVQDLKTEIILKQNEILKYKDRIAYLEREMNKEKTFAEVTPDGEILRVADEEGFAWIDLGRDNRLRRGLVFDVFQYVKGGRKLRKGKVEVARIEDKYAEVKILESLDRFNPISAGDKIASPFYDESAVPVFVIAGEKLYNNRLSKGVVERRIADFGGKVEDDVRVETTYLVAIDGYEETPQYKTARELGVTILRESELLEFIGF